MSTHVAPQQQKPDAAPPQMQADTKKPDIKKQVAPLGFDAAEAALKPDDKKKTEAKQPDKKPDPKVAAVVQQQRMQAYTDMRKKGANPAWMMALQKALGVSQTGLVSLEVIDALRTRQAAKGAKDGLGYLDEATLKELVAVEPSLGTIERDTKAQGLGANTSVSGNGGVPEDAAMVALDGKFGKNYADYVRTQLKSGTFLGFPVVLHPDMHARLANATAYLQAKMKESDPKTLAEKLGVKAVSHFRSSSPGDDQMHHATGFAIDINPEANRWLFNGKYDDVTKGETALTYAVRRAGELFGGQAVDTGLQLTNNAGKMDTESLFTKLENTNVNFKRYRELIHDKGALKAYVEGPDCPKKAKDRGVDYWLTKSKIDENNLRDNLRSPDGKQSKTAGFMDLKVETVAALRDAAGLRWGGADLGSANGDLMHFDGHFMSLASRIHNAKQGAMQKSGDKPKKTKD